MTRAICFGAIVLGAFIVAGICSYAILLHQEAVSARAPKLEVYPRHQSLGFVLEGERPPTAEFEVKNVGNTTLLITRVVPLCSCEDIELIKSKLDAGESTFLRVHAKPTTISGPVSAALNLHCDDPTQPVTRITFSWEVNSIAYFAPHEVSLQIADDGTQAAVGVKLFQCSDINAADIEGTESWPDLLSATFEPATTEERNSDGHSVVGTLFIGSSSEAIQDGAGWVRVRLRNRVQSPAVLVKWHRKSTIRADPSRIYLGRLAPGASVRRDLTIWAEPKQEFQIHEVRLRSKTVRTQLGSENRAESHHITIEVTAPTKRGVLNEDVIVESDNGDEVLVKVVGIVQ